MRSKDNTLYSVAYIPHMKTIFEKKKKNVLILQKLHEIYYYLYTESCLNLLKKKYKKNFTLTKILYRHVSLIT